MIGILHYRCEAIGDRERNFIAVEAWLQFVKRNAKKLPRLVTASAVVGNKTRYYTDEKIEGQHRNRLYLSEFLMCSIVLPDSSSLASIIRFHAPVFCTALPMCSRDISDGSSSWISTENSCWKRKGISWGCRKCLQWADDELLRIGKITHRHDVLQKLFVVRHSSSLDHIDAIRILLPSDKNELVPVAYGPRNFLFSNNGAWIIYCGNYGTNSE